MKKTDPITHQTYPALNKPLLLMGCPRGTFGIGIGLACLYLLFGSKSISGIFISLGIGAGAWFLGVVLHAYDPKFWSAVDLWWHVGKYYDAGRRKQR